MAVDEGEDERRPLTPSPRTSVYLGRGGRAKQRENHAARVDEWSSYVLLGIAVALIVVAWVKHKYFDE